MAKTTVKVPYNHDPENLATIYLAVTDKAKPPASAWRPAFRDIDRSGRKPQRIVFAYFPATGRNMKVWLRDAEGDRPCQTQVV